MTNYIKGYQADSYFLFVDVETNGLPKKRNRHYSEIDIWPRIVQMSWGIYDINGNLVKLEDHIIKPDGFEIDKKSESIHGISNEKALAEGKNINDIIEIFLNDLKLKNLKSVICHNVNFDINVIKSELFRLDKKIKLNKLEVICTMLATTEFCELPSNFSDYKYPKLEELYQLLFEEGMDNAHDSKYDVINLAKCFFSLLHNDTIEKIGIKQNIKFIKS